LAGGNGSRSCGAALPRGFRDQISLGLTYWRYYLYATAALLVVTALEIAVPTLVGLAVDHGIESLERANRRLTRLPRAAQR